MEKSHRRRAVSLFHPSRENLFIADLHFDAQGRAQVRALRDATAHPYTSRDIHHLERIEHRVAAGIPDHGVFRGIESIFRFEFLDVRNVFQAAISVWRLDRKCPVIRRLIG